MRKISKYSAYVVAFATLSSIPLIQVSAETKYTPSRFEVTEDMLGGGLVVSVPNDLHLSLNSKKDLFTSSGVVTAKGNINPAKRLKIYTDTKSSYTHADKNSLSFNADVEFGSGGTVYYSATELKNNLTLQNPTSYNVNVSAPYSDVSYIGEYESNILFNISVEPIPEDYSLYFTYSEVEVDTETKYMINGFSEYGLARLSRSSSDDTVTIILPSYYNDIEVIGVEFDSDASVNNIEKVDADGMPSQEWVFPSNYTNCSISTKYSNGLSKLTKLTLNSELSYIETSSLQGCTIDELVIPSNATLSSSVLKGARIERLVLEDGVSLNSSSLNYSNIGELVLPESINSIPSSAFMNSNIDTLVIPSSVISIGTGAFSDTSIKSLYIYGDMSSSGDYLGTNTNIKNLYLSKNFIDSWSSSYGIFPYRSKVNNIELEDGIVEIPRNIFSSIDIESVSFPETLEIIGERAFYQSEIDNLVFPNSLRRIEDYAFYGSSSGSYTSSVSFNDGLEYIGNYAFAYNLNGIEELLLPNSVNYIGECTFSYNTTLKSVSTFGDSITNSSNSMIGTAFVSSDNLTKVELPDSIRNVGSSSKAQYLGYTGSLVLPQYVEYVYLAPYYSEIIFPDNTKPMAEELVLGSFSSSRLLNSIELSNNVHLLVVLI